MNLIEIADDELAKAIRKADLADDAFGAALKAHGVERYSKINHPAVKTAYDAKVAADAAMHEAFKKSRTIRRACIGP